MKIEITKQFKEAINLFEKTNNFIFLTGKAGTGKSTLLSYFRSKTKKNIVVLAPTGVAAVNIQGETIHSFFKFAPTINLETAKSEAKDIRKKKNKHYKLTNTIETIIIDEISMVRADLFDCIDQHLRIVRNNKTAFGGVQMICIGDLYQLPPVAKYDEKKILKQIYRSVYFFDSFVMQEIINLNRDKFTYIELNKVFRQKDNDFITMLQHIRTRDINENDTLQIINKNLISNPLQHIQNNQKCIYLATVNQTADEINRKQLDTLKTKPYEFEAYVSGNFTKERFPTEETLILKKGAKVMLLNNDRSGRWVNGTIGTIIDIRKNEDEIDVKLVDGKIHTVTPYTWEMFRTVYNEIEKKLDIDTIGSFTQFPLRLSWAITIHKSQGKTFDEVVIDLGKSSFAEGQTYVALSRCKTLTGIYLTRPIKASDIRLNYTIVKFVTNIQYKIASDTLSLNDKVTMLKDAISNSRTLKIIYLKAKDERSERDIKPYKVGKMKFAGNDFIGVSAFCKKSKADRVFNVERIINIKEVL